MVGLLVFASLVWTRLLPLVVLFGAAFWLIRWLATGKVSIRTPVDWGNLLLLLMAVVSSLVTSLPERTIPQVLRLLLGVIFFYAVVNWSHSNRRINLLISILALTGLALSLFALVSVEWVVLKLPLIPYQIYYWFPLIVSDTINPNVMAGTLLLFAPIVGAVAVFNRWRSLEVREKKVAYLLSWLSLILIALILLLTASRGAWIAVIAAAAILFALRWTWGFLVFAAVVGIAVLLPYVIEPFDLLRIALENQTLGSMAGREEVWLRAIYLVEDFPFTGVGMGTFSDIAAILYPLIIVSPEKSTHAHNLFLQVAVDLGIPGLIAWISVLLVVLIVAWRLYRTGRRTNDPWVAGLGAGYFCTTAALVLHGLVDSVVWGMVRQASVVWMLWGAAIASFLVLVPLKSAYGKGTNH